MAKKRKKSKQTAKVVERTERLPPKIIPDVTVKPEIDEDPWESDGLTIRQRGFVKALIGPAGGIAAKAAEMAGYASDNRNALRATASYLLTIPNVQKAIALELAHRNLTPEWVKKRLTDLASADMANFVTVDIDGRPSLDFAKAASMGAIGQIKEYQEEGFKGSDGEEVIIKRKIKLHDPGGAIGNLLKLFGLITEGQQEPDAARVIRMRPVNPIKPDANNRSPE